MLFSNQANVVCLSFTASWWKIRRDGHSGALQSIWSHQKLWFNDRWVILKARFSHVWNISLKGEGNDTWSIKINHLEWCHMPNCIYEREFSILKRKNKTLHIENLGVKTCQHHHKNMSRRSILCPHFGILFTEYI